MTVVEIERADVERRAYALWEARGRAHGHDRDDWYAAVEQLAAEAVERFREPFKLDAVSASSTPRYKKDAVRQVYPMATCRRLFAGSKPYQVTTLAHGRGDKLAEGRNAVDAWTIAWSLINRSPK